MWTIGYISAIYEKDFCLLTYSHVDKDLVLRREIDATFHKNEIVGIKLSEKIINGISDYKVEDICHYSDLPKSDIKIFYAYQNYLYDIANNRFDTENFYISMKQHNVSRILLNNLQKVLNRNYDFIYDYIDNISIDSLIKERNVKIVEHLYDKNGDYSCRAEVECTEYLDSYLNSLLHIVGSYSPYCVNNSPKQEPNESYQQAVERVIEETKVNAKSLYLPKHHLNHLLQECSVIENCYMKEKNEILDKVKYYLEYTPL